MKKLPIAAAALLFGTSAYAMMPPGEPTGVMVPNDPYIVTPTAEPIMAADEAPAFQPATETWWADKANAADDGFKTVAATDDMKMADMADAVDKADAKVVADGADADWAAAQQAKLDAVSTDEPVLQPAAYETGFSVDNAAPAESSDMSGAGGPYESVETAAADTAPRAAARNYPACRPGPGDDRCIQLYEPGVRAELASWTQPSGGFAGAADTQVAMGGPYEPVDSATETERLNQQALADSNAAIRMASAEAPVPDDSAIETASADDGTAASYDEPTGDEDVGEV